MAEQRGPESREIEYMRMAVREARRSQPEDDRPHPFVGAVVVRNNEVLATACRGDQAPGDHAEYGVLEKKLASETLTGCTVYTTLEPCTTRNHPKVPCADRLIERRVSRVVIGSLDPDQRITGKGILRLRRAGIAVELFPPDLMAQLEELNREFFRECAILQAHAPRPADKLIHDLATWLLTSRLDDPLIQGIALREAGQAGRAIQCLEEACRAVPNDPRYHSNLAYAYEKNASLEQAIGALTRALEIRRKGDGIEWPRYHFHLARYYSARGARDDTLRASQHLARAIAAGDVWRQKAIRESGLFALILDDALAAGAKLADAETATRDATLDEVKRVVSKVPRVVCAGIYGSYWLNGATTYRDIDVCAVIDTVETLATLSSVPATAYNGTPINIYAVPREVLLADMDSAAYGQYFSHKLILGAEGILNEPEMESFVLLAVQQAIRNAVAWRSRRCGDDLLGCRHTSDWFLAAVLGHRLSRDKTFGRCLRRLFDHHSDQGLSRVRSVYENALRSLRRDGSLVDGPGRDSVWMLDEAAVREWEQAVVVTDVQIAERFWRTYEAFKGQSETQRKQAMVEGLPLRSTHWIENQIDRLLRDGAVAPRGLTKP